MLKRTKRLLLGSGIGVGGFYIWDKNFNHSTFGRNIRTMYTATLIALDYKLNFNENNVDNIDAIHTRTANRILNCCQENGGLYIKFGQQIAQQSAFLPKPYQEIFKVMYDSAPVVDYKQVEKIFLKEFGKKPDEMFNDFTKEAVASASIAQVHQAKLKDGTEVAIKIQKPNIEKQLDYDMFAYRNLVYIFEKLFDLPMYWITEYTEQQLRKEIDFINEGKNSELCYNNIIKDNNLKDKIYVPKVFWDFTSKRILTTEWIDGVPFTKVDEIKNKGFNCKQIMTNLIDLFSSQIFVSGFLHCDPHPGNIIIRNNKNNKMEVVLLDHGLYIKEREEFRHQYALFWKSMFLMELETMQRIGKDWGIKDVELFASATLLKPFNIKQSPIHSTNSNIINSYEKQVEMKKRFKDFLSNSEKLPLELIFLGRNMNIVRANNKQLGSPVNRIKLMVQYAVIGLHGQWKDYSLIASNNTMQISNKHNSSLNYYYYYLKFQFSLFVLDLIFYSHQLYSLIASKIFNIKKQGFEDLMDSNIENQIKDTYGIDLNLALSE